MWEPHSLVGIHLRMDDEWLTDNLPGELSPRPGKEGIVPGLVYDYRGEARTGEVPANKETLGEIGFEEGFVLDDL